ncbi:MAG: hypothetical protein ACR2IR_13335 [Acidimicrobiia bacterium]
MTLLDSQPSTDAPAPHRLGRWSRRFPRAIPMLVLAGLVLVLNPLHVRAYTKVSPFDEYAHIDSMIRGSRGQILVQPDDKLLQETLDEVACREADTEVTGLRFPRCREGRYDPATFAYRGWNQASAHTPYYYVLTGVAARALRAPSPPDDSIVTWARLLGAVWLLVGMYLVLRAGEYLGVARVPLVLALVLVAASPALLHASTTVNPDGAAFIGGAAVLLAALAWEQGRRSMWLLGLSAFFCASLDTTNIMGVIVVVAYFSARAFASYRGLDRENVRQPWTAYAGATAAMGAASFVAIFGWKLVYNLFAHDVDLSGHPARTLFDIDHLDVGLVLGRDTLFGVVPPIEGYMPGTLASEPYQVFVGATALLVVGALVAAAISFKPSDRLTTLGVATLVALVVSSPVLVLYNYVSDGLYYPILTRQALATLPAAAIVIAGIAQTPVARGLLAAIAGGLYLTAVMALL